MKQPIFTPEILDCAKCGCKGEVIDWDFNEQYEVMCKNNHCTGGKCISSHRAICRWNNKQEKIKLEYVE